jgi:hypothetical protein
MHISKPSKKVDELYKGWLIFSPNVPRQYTGNTPPNSEKELDERSTPLPEAENPKSTATGETP